MRIAILGVGGAGGYFGAQLARAGEDVSFIARGEHLDAIRQHGLTVETDDDTLVIHPTQTKDKPEELDVVDCVIVAVKTHQLVDALNSMRPIVGPDTFVVPLQNGVEAPSQIAEVLGEKHALGGLCGTLSQLTGPGRIRSLGSVNFVKFGELDNKMSERTERLRNAFAKAGVTVEIPDNISSSLWEKFLFVVSAGGVGAVTRSPIGVIRSVPETRRMLEQCMREIESVAEARRLPLPETIVENSMKFVDSLAPEGTASLQRDIADGRPSELEAWNGAVVRLAREVDVATPLHEFIYHSLLPLELQARGELTTDEVTQT